MRAPGAALRRQEGFSDREVGRGGGVPLCGRGSQTEQEGSEGSGV